MVIRFALIGVLLVGGMLAIRDGRLTRHFGVVARCETIDTPFGQSGVFKECHKGKIDGRRDLTENGCKVVRTDGDVDVWQCLPDPIWHETPA